MKFLSLPILAALSTAAVAQDSGVAAQNPSTAGTLQSSNILNPNISVIGWVQAEAGHRHRGPGDADETGETFQMKEAELAIQSVVDSWARADFFIGFSEEETALEEGTLTWLKLPAYLGLKAGTFKANLGRFNRTHTAETAFADRPLVHQNFFGEEGLNGPGVSLSWQAPIPWFFLNADLEAIRAPAAEDSPAFDRARSKDIVGIGRLSGFYDLTESWNLNLGGSAALGPAGQAVDAVTFSSHTLHSRIYGTDLTLRWKNPRRAIYRSFYWTTEAFWSDREATLTEDHHSHGWFSHAEYQFARRWRGGVRYDYSQFLTPGLGHEEGQLAYVSFDPSEFSRISLQGRRVKRADGADEHLGFLKVTFNIGPHGAHPF